MERINDIIIAFALVEAYICGGEEYYNAISRVKAAGVKARDIEIINSETERRVFEALR